MVWRDPLRAATPAFALSLYRRSRHALRSVIRAFAKVRTCRIRGITIRIGISSEIEQFRAESYATKEPETLDWLETNLRDCDVFMDVGANIGLYSLYAAKLKPSCTVYSFEPESQNFSRLCRNIVINALPNIIPCNFPLSDREAFDLFYVGTIQAGAALHSLGRPSDFRSQADGVALKQGAVAVTLDALVCKYGAPWPALLKIDVDGIEEKVIGGAETVLSSSKLRTILVEVSFRQKEDAMWAERTLNRFGYKLLRKSVWVEDMNGLKSQNYNFSR